VSEALRVWAKMAVLASALLATVSSPGCGVSKSGIGSGLDGSAGIGGTAQNHGGTVGGSATATGGTTIAGTGGTTIAGTGGTTIAGTGGTTIVGTGGMVRGGAGGITTVGTGGRSSGGTGGNRTGGSGGRFQGGAGGTAAVGSGAPDAPPPKCSEVITQAACDARSDCHSVFEDPGTCGCASPGCCAHFRSCADGTWAACLGPALCDMVEPFCELPYVIAYKNMCYEGCVQQTDCLVPPCPYAPPKDGTYCGTATFTCYYEDCAGAGRTVATCASQAWQAESAACDSFACQAEGANAEPLTCAAGEVCMLTRNTSFTWTAACVEHACGTGPMSTDCLNGLGDSCSAEYKLSGVVVTCTMPVP
jgi:hypothetical protein